MLLKATELAIVVNLACGSYRKRNGKQAVQLHDTTKEWMEIVAEQMLSPAHSSPVKNALLL